MARADLVIQAPDIATPQIKELARLAEADTIAALSAASTQAFRVSPARRRDGGAVSGNTKSIFVCSRSTRAIFTVIRSASRHVLPLRSPTSAG